MAAKLRGVPYNITGTPRSTEHPCDKIFMHYMRKNAYIIKLFI